MSSDHATHPDDEFHPPTSDNPYWTETRWFTFAAPEHKLSGQLYPFFRPNPGAASGLVPGQGRRDVFEQDHGAGSGADTSTGSGTGASVGAGVVSGSGAGASVEAAGSTLSLLSEEQPNITSANARRKANAVQVARVFWGSALLFVAPTDPNRLRSWAESTR